MKGIVRAAALSAAATLVGCATTTKVTSSWKDPAAATAKVEKVLVIGLVPEESVRRNLEEKLANELRQKGAQASPSSQFVQEGASLTKEKVKQIVEGNDFDSVLVAQYQGTERKFEYVPGTYEDYFSFMYPTVYRPGYTRETREVKLESRLFHAENGGKMVWSATTSTFDPSSAEKAIPEVAKKIVDKLDKDVPI